MGLWGTRRVVAIVLSCPLALAMACADDATPPGPPAGGTRAVAVRVDTLLSSFGVRQAPEARGASRVRASLPSMANEAFELEDAASGMTIRVALTGARPAPLEVDGAHGLASGAAPHGGDLVLRAHAYGLEDFVRFETPPAEEALSWDVDVSEVAGLRLSDDVVELVDALGTPRLRMERPYVLDVRGERARAGVSVEGCAHDVDSVPFAPPSQAPGSPTCRVRVTWAGLSLDYPVLVDPNWTTAANNMSAARVEPTATALASGKVLVVGGYSGTTPLNSTELFDPTTSTFAVAKPFVTARSTHTAVRTGSGASEKVTIAGGLTKSGTTNVVLKSVEVYDVTTNTWTAGVDMAATRYGHAMAVYPQNNQILVSGGFGAYNSTVLASTELWNGSAWVAADPMATPRAHHEALAVKTSEIWLVGGYTGSAGSTGAVDKYTGGTRTVGPPMVNAHSEFGATVLANGTVLVHAGNGVGLSAEYHDGLKWNVTAQAWRRDHTAFTLGDGTALVAGFRLDALRFDPVAQKFHFAGNLNKNRYHHAGANLPGNRVLVVGGADPSAGTQLADGEVFGLAANGQACTSPGECASLKCVEGVCCNSDCTGTCQSCVNAKTGAASGTCASIKVGTDPDNDCAADAQSTCGNDGMCDGAGACRKWPSGTQCGSSCVNGTQTTLGCSGTGVCSQALSSKSCGGPPCANAQVCSTTCGAGSPCQAGFWCDAGTCKAQLAKGSVCTSAAQCSTGSCADGICCDQACTGLCQSCKAASKGYGADGDCGFVKDGVDVDAECAVDSTNGCGDDGACNGAGACRKRPAGTACGAAACQNAVTAAASSCNGLGVCQSTPGGTPCEPYRCDSAKGTCKTTCAALADCAPGSYCDLGLCVPTKIFGVPCGAATECISGFCVDGVCCDSQCGGQCEACAETGNLGKCVTVSGAPRPGRAQCNGSGNCQGKCDGTDKNTCTYPGTATACGALASCTGDVSAPQGACDGTGACATPATKSCLPYGCDASNGACKSACASDADCAQGAKCDTNTGKCAITSATCKDSSTVQMPNGQTTDCSPYKCSAGACETKCASKNDCADGFDCEASSCVKASGTGGSGTGGSQGGGETSDDGGCGCRVPAGGSGSTGPWLAAFLAAAAALRRRVTPRRRAEASST